MEEDGVAKAPVTRLRRRLSVECEDVKSPSTPSTPNKKRGGRLAAKPQLELIDENATENVSKRSTRKSVVKDITEPVEEKPATPSRRSARIKSNTSIISDTIQVTDSPRAKRVARRNSQIGSDNEAPSTPVRSTRRTRKDSTSSIDKQAETTSTNKIEPVVEVIPEEVENNSKEDGTDNIKASVRKSPRLTKKNDRRHSSTKQDLESNEELTQQKNEQQTNVTENASRSGKQNTISNNDAKSVPINKENKIEEKAQEQNNISIATTNLLNNLNMQSKKTASAFNKSTSALEVSNNFKNKRQRTKSWTTVSIEPPNVNDGIFYSDNECTKKKIKSRSEISKQVNKSGSGDNALNITDFNNKSEEAETVENYSSTLRQERNEKTMVADTNVASIVSPVSEKSKKLRESCIETPKAADHSNSSNKENISLLDDDKTINLNASEKMFEKAPTGKIQSLVFIEDSDSNTGSIEKAGTVRNVDGEDQCVPVVENPLDNKKLEDSCEPMDIDVTIPGNKSASFKINTSNSSRRKSSLSMVPENLDVTNKSVNKSKRKSSISHMESQNLEKSLNENKSTLILSQIKDTSTNDVSSSKSPKVTNESSNSNTVRNVTKDKKSDQQISSLTYLTSTPLPEKPFTKNMQMNTSIILSTDHVKEIKNSSKVDISQTRSEESSEEESEEEIELRQKNKILDDEAEEASDDYESGDSRDDDERQYEEDNEIRERGETLNSEEDISDDSDYEKDSFIVSSDEEDNDLLSGSGDDLSLSDKELSMSAKSKKKYNERKEKERKKASKEMYEARHNINKSDIITKSDKPKPKKSNRLRLDSTLLDSDDEESIQPKKSKRLRIDSSQDSIIEADESSSKTNRKAKRLSESLVNNSLLNEKEITISNGSILEKIDPLAHMKQEANTPQKEDGIADEDCTDREEVEEVNVAENMSVLNVNETSDPLQAATDESSSSSDNNEIMENFDSMLNELNNDVKSKRAKLWDTSLNLNKKAKSKPNELIVDQLNLTVTKKCKKIKSVDKADKKEKSQELKIQTTKSDEEISSDSIDMLLLFPEDSNDSETTADKSTNKTSNNDRDDFIPLKRTEAKTDITDSNNKCRIGDALNVSKKKNKRKSSLCPPEDPIPTNEGENVEVSLVGDTTRTELKVNTSANTSIKDSAKKKKNKNSSISFVNDAEVDNNDKSKITEDALNISKEKNKRKSSICLPEDSVPVDVGEKDDVSFFVDTTGTGFHLNTSANASARNSAKKNKNSKISIIDDAVADNYEEVKEKNMNKEGSNSKKRKRMTSAELSVQEDFDFVNMPVVLNNSISAEKQNKKRKILQNLNVSSKQSLEDTTKLDVHQVPQHTRKQEDTQVTLAHETELIPKNKKRKQRDNDEEIKMSKVYKQNSLDDIHVPRLPAEILSYLDDKPKTENLVKKKSQVISTTQFIVEQTKKKKNKPSNYLEESVYINDSPVEAKKQKSSLKNPKVLPFIPTASTSTTGFTTNFRVNPMPREAKFTAQSNDLPNFKNDFLQDRRVKKMGTYEMYKRRRNIKLSKF